MSAASPYDQALSLFASLSFTEKLSFVAEAATTLKKEGKTGSVGKAAKKEKKEKDPDAPKRAMAVGTLAWQGFVAHCKDSMPERFADVKKVSEKLTICKEIRAEDEEAYQTFVNNFKSKHASASAPASAPASTAASPAPVKTEVKKETLEEKKKKIAEAKAAKTATPEKKPAAAEPKAPAKPKKEPKKVKGAAAAAEVKEENKMPKKEVDGETYFFDPDTNGLWKVDEDDKFGAWVGFFQGGNEEEPIRYTESMAD